jgi:hypothetical protein
MALIYREKPSERKWNGAVPLRLPDRGASAEDRLTILSNKQPEPA